MFIYFHPPPPTTLEREAGSVSRFSLMVVGNYSTSSALFLQNVPHMSWLMSISNVKYVILLVGVEGGGECGGSTL